MTSHLRLVAVAAWALALVSGSPAAEMPAAEADTVAPSVQVAAERGPQIFNTVFDSLRKWGAVTHRNGMSFMLATVPQNVLLYHGNDRNATPTTLDWLAYEIEHAEMFARANHFGPPRRRPGHGDHGDHWEVEGHDDAAEDIREDLKRRSFEQGSPAKADEPNKHGWLHVYRTTRPLRFLYIDGMSGDKDTMGVLDTQDFLLRGVRDEPTWPPRWPPRWPPKQPPKQPPRTKEDEQLPGVPGEQNRVRDICQMCADWDLQGVIRTEWLGFEIIKCDFFDGMDHVQSLQRDDENPDLPPWFPQPGQPFKPGRPWGAYLDLGDRFREVNPGRTVLDYSSIVSAYFFPVNITNPDEEHAERPRLLNTTEAELATIKQYLSDVIDLRRHDATGASYEWRYVADDIVHRYTPKILSMLNSTSSAEDVAKDTRFLLEAFIDYSINDVTKRDSEAEKRCTAFYLQTLPRDGDADVFLYSAFEAVSAEICSSLFEVRKLVAGKTDVAAETLEAARSILGTLVDYLAWHVFESIPL